MAREIDETTGLPVLPENQFWRVTEGRKLRYDEYYYMHRREIVESDFVNTGPEVHLVEKKTVTTVIKGSPIYERSWFVTKLVGHKPDKELVEEIERVVARKSLKVNSAHKDKVPPFAIEIQNLEPNRNSPIRHFRLPLTPEGVAFAANKILDDLDKMAEDALARKEEQRKRDEAAAELARAKESLYGDYPPKSLI